MENSKIYLLGNAREKQQKKERLKGLRILMVTPEITGLPGGMTGSQVILAKAGGLADVAAGLVDCFYADGMDIHVAIPHYRAMHAKTVKPFALDSSVHLAQDCRFFYQKSVYSTDAAHNTEVALCFQREVINNIIPRVRPDLIHCNDWMTGLIPAAAKQMGIPCLFSLHNIHTVKSSLAEIESHGIDAPAFWDRFYYEYMPQTDYRETRISGNRIDFLASAIFAADYVNTVSPAFLKELSAGQIGCGERSVVSELARKRACGCAVGILNAPDKSYNPKVDNALICRYGPENHVHGKRKNKRALQQRLKLCEDDHAPVFFWPHRLDSGQKGCELLLNILSEVVFKYREQNLEMVFVADGESQKDFKAIVHHYRLHEQVAIYDFDEKLQRLAYGASDFMMMPSKYEPCGLPQMIAPIYGALPVAHDTGGIHDTVVHINVNKNRGNGFLFENYDANGLFWAIDRAMDFYNLPRTAKEEQIKRIMLQSSASFNHEVMARNYLELYKLMLRGSVESRLAA